MSVYLTVAVFAYLVGSIPFGFVLMKLLRGSDVRSTGSGNIGATNVARTDPVLGVLTLVLDAAKGYIAVWAAGWWAGTHADSGVNGALVVAIAALAAILGHVFTFWLKFKGGKGVATGVGAFLALAPAAVAVALAVFLVLVAAFRYVSLGSVVATAVFPIAAYLLQPELRDLAVLAVTLGGAALIIGKHHQNIRRLLSGSETKFELKGRTS